MTLVSFLFLPKTSRSLYQIILFQRWELGCDMHNFIWTIFSINKTETQSCQRMNYKLVGGDPKVGRKKNIGGPWSWTVQTYDFMLFINCFNLMFFFPTQIDLFLNDFTVLACMFKISYTCMYFPRHFFF